MALITQPTDFWPLIREGSFSGVFCICFIQQGNEACELVKAGLEELQEEERFDFALVDLGHAGMFAVQSEMVDDKVPLCQFYVGLTLVDKFVGADIPALVAKTTELISQFEQKFDEVKTQEFARI